MSFLGTGFSPAPEELILVGSGWCAPQISHHCVFLWLLVDTAARLGRWPRGGAQAAAEHGLSQTHSVLVLGRLPVGGPRAAAPRGAPETP